MLLHVAEKALCKATTDTVADETLETWAADGPQERNMEELARFFSRSPSSGNETPRTAILFDQAMARTCHLRYISALRQQSIET